MFDLLPSTFSQALSKLDLNCLNEIRLRVGLPTMINYNGWHYLGKTGLVEKTEALIPCFEELQDIVYNACECSVYAHNDELTNGYITYKNMRIGVSGDVVTNKAEVLSIKNFSSLVIRLIHAVENCSSLALPYLMDKLGIYSTLVVSPPGCGKTTFIRDLTWQISSHNLEKNILVIDERNEIACMQNGKPTLCVGDRVDVISRSSKLFGLTCGVRSLSPNVVVFDEIMSEVDCRAILNALGCGVKIIATIHSLNFDTLRKKSIFPLLKEVFNRVVVLSARNGAGTIEEIRAIDGNVLYEAQK